MEKIYTLSGVLKKAVGEFPTRRALSVSNKYDITHAHLQELIQDAATCLALSGVRPDDVVALTFPNTAEVISCKRAPTNRKVCHSHMDRTFSRAANHIHWVEFDRWDQYLVDDVRSTHHVLYPNRDKAFAFVAAHFSAIKASPSSSTNNIIVY